jgi:catechol 2,3-dioxygenase-like lactoylglutathione lyase family enzyme
MNLPGKGAFRSLYMVELIVSDWPASVAWYRDLLGLSPALTDVVKQFALFEVGDGRLALKAGAPQPGNGQLAFEVEDLIGLVERLAERRVVSEGPIQDSPEGYRRAVIRDPDGHRLCLFEWRR